MMQAAPTAKRGRKIVIRDEEEEGMVSDQTTQHNLVTESVYMRTRQRTRLSKGVATPVAAIAAPTGPAATAGRRLSKSPPQVEEKGGKKSSQTRGKKKEETKERKRSAEDTPEEVPKKQPRVITRKVSTADVRGTAEIEEKDDEVSATLSSETGKKKLKESVMVVGQVYKDKDTGRKLVVEAESASKKSDRIEGWVEDSFNRTFSDIDSLDESAGPSTSAHSGECAFEKDNDVESFGKMRN